MCPAISSYDSLHFADIALCIPTCLGDMILYTPEQPKGVNVTIKTPSTHIAIGTVADGRAGVENEDTAATSSDTALLSTVSRAVRMS